MRGKNRQKVDQGCNGTERGKLCDGNRGGTKHNYVKGNRGGNGNVDEEAPSLETVFLSSKQGDRY